MSLNIFLPNGSLLRPDSLGSEQVRIRNPENCPGKTVNLLILYCSSQTRLAEKEVGMGCLNITLLKQVGK